MSLAIYGKGGIGKTTIACNVASVLGSLEKKVIVLGCDPKRDSARLICGSRIPALLDVYDSWDSISDFEQSGLIRTGNYGVKVVEVGGPRPGVGCAGKGLMLALGFLRSKNMFEGTDVAIFDILGDVVCGGFAVPVTHRFVDRVALVISGEFSSLFAANNILKGMKALGAGVVGLVLNNRGGTENQHTSWRFAEKVGLEVIGEIPFSDALSRADGLLQTIDKAETSNVVFAFQNLAQRLVSSPVSTSYTPLDDEGIYMDIGRR
ncbi:MAG: P-loop NTPase [Bacteroidota bacterium]